MADEINKQVRMEGKLVPERPSPNIIVQKNFGRFIIPPTKPEIKAWQNQFPALSNNVYGHLGARKESLTEFDGAVWVKQTLQAEERARKKAMEEAKSKTSSFAVPLAQTIKWDRPTYGEEDDLIFKFDDPSIIIAEDFNAWVAYFDSQVARGVNPVEYCRICDQSHILDGPPNTIADRDACGSLLPDWFRSAADKFAYHEYSRPWDTFIRLLNDIVRTEEVDAGLRKDLDAPSKWDKNFHEPSKDWGVHRRNGGWWKCRSYANEKEGDVPLIELDCPQCHAPKTQLELDQEKRWNDAKEKMLKLRKLVTKHMELTMEQDKALVLTRLSGSGFWDDGN
jgi:hypothetical protein